MLPAGKIKSDTGEKGRSAEGRPRRHEEEHDDEHPLAGDKSDLLSQSGGAAVAHVPAEDCRDGAAALAEGTGGEAAPDERIHGAAAVGPPGFKRVSPL